MRTLQGGQANNMSVRHYRAGKDEDIVGRWLVMYTILRTLQGGLVQQYMDVLRYRVGCVSKVEAH